MTEQVKQHEVTPFWTQIEQTHTAKEYATGLQGVWDAVVAWWTGEDRRTYQHTYTYSMWVKSEERDEVLVHNVSVEQEADQ